MFTREECAYLLKMLDADDGFSDWTPDTPARSEIRRKLRSFVENIDGAAVEVVAAGIENRNAVEIGVERH